MSLLDHLLFLEVINIACMILAWLIVHPKIDKFNIYLEDECGLGPQCAKYSDDFSLELKRKKRGKRISADGIGLFIDSLRGRQLPLSLYIAGHQVTVIVYFCVNGRPGDMQSSFGSTNFNLHPAPDFRGGFLDVEGMGVAHERNLNPAESMRCKNT